jgi:hypothetical protein
MAPLGARSSASYIIEGLGGTHGVGIGWPQINADERRLKQRTRIFLSAFIGVDLRRNEPHVDVFVANCGYNLTGVSDSP